jgi:threonine dehydratase
MAMIQSASDMRSPDLVDDELPLPPSAFAQAARRIAGRIHHTPTLSSRTLSELTGFDVRLKAELLQRTGSYKIRGPLNKLGQLNADERKRGVICSSAGNHAQGVALAAKIYSIPATVVMATNATPSKVEATRAYGANVVLHGSIWDEADARARELVQSEGFVYVHPFDDLELIAGQGTVGWEIYADWPEVDVAVVPIGGGGLISGVAMALKGLNPDIRIVGVESAGAPAMQRSVAEGTRITLDQVDCKIDGLKVMRVGETTFEVVRRYVDAVVALPDREIFDAMLWTWSKTKLLAEAAAAAPVAALLHGLVEAPPGSKVACVLSGGNVNLDQIRGMDWN